MVSPYLVTNETYLKNEWRLPQNEHHKVKKAMKFKDDLGERLPGNEDDILVIYSDKLNTFDTIGYSSTGIAIDKKTLHFSPPDKQHGDIVVVTDSAMGSMPGSHTYKNSICIPNVTHTDLPNHNKTIAEIKNFLKI